MAPTEGDVWGWLLAVTALGAPVDDLLRAGDVSAALEAAKAAAARSPSDVGAQELYYDLLVASGRGAQALAEARAEVAESPSDPDRQYLLGRATTDPAMAEAAYRKALSLSPNHARAHMGLAAVQEAHGALADAVASYTRAIDLDGGLAEAWVGRARTEIRLGRTDAALATARAGVKKHPASSGLLVVLARLAPSEAAPLLATATGANPRDATLQDALADARLELNDAQGALAAATAALALDGTLGSAARTATLAREQIEGRLDRSGRHALMAATGADALAKLGALAKQYPRSASVLVARSGARSAAGDKAGAVADLVAAADLDAKNLEAQAAAGSALLDAKRFAEAQVPLGRAFAQRPNDIGLGLALVRAQSSAGSAGEALQTAESLASRFPTQPDVALAAATQLAAAGRAVDAYNRLKPALVRTSDPRLAAAFVQVAPAAGHPDEAAALLEKIVAQTGNAQLAEAAKRLRAMAAAPAP